MQKEESSLTRKAVTPGKQQLFPNQRVAGEKENICYYYAKWGKGLLGLCMRSLGLEQEFVVLRENNSSSGK